MALTKRHALRVESWRKADSSIHPATRFEMGALLVSRLFLVSCLLAVASLTSTSAQIVSSSRMSATMPVSDSVVAMYAGQPVEPGMQRLQLLVLWRGEPGWFGRSGSRGGSGGNGDFYSIRSEHGGVELQADIDFRTERITVLGQAFDLRTSNIILIDGVGGQPRVVGTLGVQAQVQVVNQTGTSFFSYLSALFEQPEIKTFLRCDQRASIPVSVSQSLCGPRR